MSQVPETGSEARPPDDVVAFDTAITTEDWVDFALRNARAYHAPRRLRGLLFGVAALPVFVLLGALLGWATGGAPPSSLGDLFAAPNSANGPLLLWLGLSAVLLLGRYAFHDRLLRRRYYRWSLREHGPEPSPFRCRLDAAGYTAVDAGGDARKAWSSLTSFEETDRQFFLVGMSGHVVPIPKRGVSAADQARLRALVRAHLPDPARAPDLGDAVLPPEAAASSALIVRYRQTAQDQAAVTLLAWNTPARRRRRALVALATALGLALCLFAVDAFGWWLDGRASGETEPLAAALPTFLRHEASIFALPATYAAGLGVALWLSWPWLLRRQARAMARLRGDVAVALAFGDAGVSGAVPGTEFRYAWGEVRAVLEGPGHFGLVLPLSVILPVPKRALGAGELALLRDLLTLHTGQARTHGGAPAPDSRPETR